MQASGTGEQDLGVVFTAPVSGHYAHDTVFTAGTVTGGGLMKLASSDTNEFYCDNETQQDGGLKYLVAGDTISVAVEKSGVVTNEPTWTLKLRVRLVGGPDLTQED